MMMNENGGIKIDKGVPIPGSPRRGPGSITRTLKSMDVGDSFLHLPEGRSISAQRVRMYQNAKLAGVTIAIRTEGEGFRVWKTGRREDSSNGDAAVRGEG